MPVKDRISLLDVIPSRKLHIITEEEEGLSVIAFPRFKRAWMQRFLLPKGMSPYIRVRLEEHGTAVWNLIDGRRTVQEIISLLGEYFNYSEGYEERVMKFIMQLHKDKFIVYLRQTRE